MRRISIWYQRGACQKLCGWIYQHPQIPQNAQIQGKPRRPDCLVVGLRGLVVEELNNQEILASQPYFSVNEFYPWMINDVATKEHLSPCLLLSLQPLESIHLSCKNTYYSISSKNSQCCICKCCCKLINS